jgi:outer membrane protein TolC
MRRLDMKKLSPVIGIILFFFLAVFTWSGQSEQAQKLSLEDCIIKGLRNNLTVAIQVLSPELADISLAQAWEKYLPSLSLSFQKRNTNQASYSWIDASENVITKRNSYAATINQTIPTGGRISLALDNYKNDSNRNLQTINPVFGSTLTFNFSQPLLKNFGWKVNQREILIAHNNINISEKDFKQVLLDTIYSIETAYWNLVYSIEDLAVRRQSLQLARDLLAKNQRAVEVGTLAPIEVVSAQSEVATREADILQAEASVKNNEDQLKTVLNFSEEEEKKFSEIIPVDKPRFERKDVKLEEALMIALQNRPDLQAARIDLQNQDINLSYAKNQILPDLSLTASYWSPGVSGTRILYQDDKPITGIVIGTIPGGASDSIKDALNFKYNNWSLGLTLDFSLNSIFSKASLAQAKVNMDQALLRFKNQEKQALLEIKNAVRAVQTNYKRVQAYRVARELAEKKLQAEEERLKVGLSTSYFVLSYQRELASARISELKAIIDYNLSSANLDKALGTTLETRNIKLSDYLTSD